MALSSPLRVLYRAILDTRGVPKVSGCCAQNRTECGHAAVAPLELFEKGVRVLRTILVRAGAAPQLIPQVHGDGLRAEGPADSRLELEVPLRPMQRTENLGGLNIVLQRKF